MEYPGGLYAVATGIDGQKSDDVHEEIDGFLTKTRGFERDPARAETGNVITSKDAQKALGYKQMDSYVPVRVKSAE